MRYYSIIVTDPKTGQVLQVNPNNNGFVPTSVKTATTFTSLNAGATPTTLGGTNGAALRVELDITVAALHVPASEAKPFVKLHGIPRALISQASYLNGKFIQVFGGMAKGLPLANPAQAGLLTSGQIQQCFGNWLGTDQNLNLYIAAGGSAPTNASAVAGSGVAPGLSPVTQNSPGNIVFVWSIGQPLMVAIATTLQNAFPQLSIQGSISENLVWASEQAKVGVYQTLQQFAAAINAMTKTIVAGPYPISGVYNLIPDPTYLGVQMQILGGTLLVTDFTTATTPKQLAFQDMIGQPTWSQPGKIQVTTVLRADIQLGDYVQVPPSPFTISAGAYTQSGVSLVANGNPQADGSVFTGIYVVQNVHHVGDSRAQGGESWTSVFDMTYAPETILAAPALPFVYKSSSNNSYGFQVA